MKAESVLSVCSSPPHSDRVFAVPRGFRIPAKLPGCVSLARLKVSSKPECHVYSRVSGGTDSLERPVSFPFKPGHSTERSQLSKKHTRSRKLIRSFLTCVSSRY